MSPAAPVQNPLVTIYAAVSCETPEAGIATLRRVYNLAGKRAVWKHSRNNLDRAPVGCGGKNLADRV